MDISQQLQHTPNWNSLNAYERAKICCQLLHTLGLPIPSWMQIRQWIGKGSANDIHRAKQEFLLDRQTVKADWVQQDDMPSRLSGSLQDWWQQLKQAAEQDYLLHKQQWQLEITELQAQLSAAQATIDQQQQEIIQRQQQLDAGQQQYQQAQQSLTLKDQLATQQAIEYQQLLDLVHTQQSHYFAEQSQQRRLQLVDQQQQHAQLEAQLNVLADFHSFAAQQIDLARQQHDQQQTLQQTLLVDLVQQILSEQRKQQHWLTEHARTTALQTKRGQHQHRQKFFKF